MTAPLVAIIAGLIVLNIAQAMYARVLERKLWLAEATARVG